MSVFIIFVSLLIFASLMQVSFYTLPFGVVLIMLWYYTQQTKNLELLVLIFSITLAVAANLSIWVVVAATTISLYLFIFGRSFLPSKMVVNIFLVVGSLAVWEFSVIVLSKLSLWEEKESGNLELLFGKDWNLVKSGKTLFQLPNFSKQQVGAI